MGITKTFLKKTGFVRKHGTNHFYHHKSQTWLFLSLAGYAEINREIVTSESELENILKSDQPK
ncbi:MAG: hypothetical protein K9J21_07060 [Bacteroidales bacterium]|nr:hypothetical protein [Bacteroidales bacterium]